MTLFLCYNIFKIKEYVCLKKNKKAFTLVELLAVIVVLAIILIIAIPRILHVIEESDKEAFRITGEQLIKGAKDRQVYETTGALEEKTYIIEDGTFLGDSIPMTGELPEEGTIQITREGLTSIAVTDDKWCARKYEEDDNVHVSKDPNCVLHIPEAVDDSCFTVQNNLGELTITDYSDSCPKDVIIPSSIGGLPVRILGDDAFYYNQLTSVTIPNSVTYIGFNAFGYNQLTSIIIPNSVASIRGLAFINNELVSLTIPDSVTIIGNQAFAFNQLASVEIPDSVTDIGTNAFYRNQLTRVTIPDSVINTGIYVFSNNKLTSVTIGNGLSIQTSFVSESFYNAYNPLKEAGIYTAPSQDGVWTKL